MSIRGRVWFVWMAFGGVAVVTCLLAPLVGSTPDLARAACSIGSIPFADNRRRADLLRGAPAARRWRAPSSAATLAASGVVLQALLRNPLATPFTLGVSAGAALGAMLAITFVHAAGASPA